MRKTLFTTLAMALAPFCAFAVDGVVLINQSTVLTGVGFPYKITQPGSYRLSGNLTVPDADTTAILVSADNVTIDLNGFSILGPTVCIPVTFCSPIGAGDGVNGGSHLSITVVNGSVRGMGNIGIFLDGSGSLVEKVHADSNGYLGILAIGTVSGNTATGNNGNGILAFCPSSVVGNTASGNSTLNIATIGPGCAVANNAAP